MVCTVVEFHDRDQTSQQVEWAVKHVPPESNPKLLDIGTGNGILPICLVEAGYSPATICGIDYSQASIELAQRIAEGRSVKGLTFREVDFIKGNVERLPGRTNTNAEIHATASEEEWDLL
jgi:EEF1A lysine methyltransferase 2